MRGWSLVAAYVAAYDTYAFLTNHKTLSTEYREAAHRYPVTVSLVTAYLLFHLYGALPRTLDPLHALGCTAQERRSARHP